MAIRESFRELLAFFKARKLYWMAPLILVFLLLSLVLISTQTSVLSPLIYALF